VDFRILGSLQAFEDDQQVALGGAKQRAVRAVLLLHRAEVVSTDHLIDELWGEKPPATAAKTIQVYVSHLRKALGDGVLETHGHGYKLVVDHGHVDLDRFESLRDAARRALGRGEAAAAADRFREAFALRRHRPLNERSPRVMRRPCGLSGIWAGGAPLDSKLCQARPDSPP
jgi:DNA-binding SARP family transcriptional activator